MVYLLVIWIVYAVGKVLMPVFSVIAGLVDMIKGSLKMIGGIFTGDMDSLCGW